MELTNRSTITFMIDNILIDIVTTDTDYEAWIYEKSYGTKNIMFGMPKVQQSFTEFIEIVEANIDDYKYLCEED